MSSGSVSSSASPLVDPAVLMRIRSLEVRARVVVEGIWRGLHRSPRHGFSVEFSEYRPYVPGDDLRHVDWRLAARSGRYFSKRYEDETNLWLQLVVDQSASMAYGSGAWSKAAYGATLAATLALFLMRQGDAVGVTTFASGVEEHVPPRNRPGHLRRLLTELERPAVGRGTSLDLSIGQLAERLRRRGVVAVVSDLLAPLEVLRGRLAELGAMGQDVVMFHVMDPAEVDLKMSEAAFFEDPEGGAGFWVDPEVARTDYRKRVEAHLAEVRAACESAGVDYHWCQTDQPLESALFDWVIRRRGVAARRRA
ncbi:MAG: DUF58 domain-containing protein [Verrucomicrobiales bacterium]|nr:DUF58 domain-containing protein [Verrucomicrobiales bacterium]